jgi:hypothetical protein
VLFAGPSLTEDCRRRLKTPLVDLREPAIRGDIDALIMEGATPQLVIIADGRFHSRLSVGHAELRRALALGIQLWGVSSMGAIRACELQGLGMNGYGDVFARFMSDADFSDDEVALLHEESIPHRSLSEPLVHIRLFLSVQVSAGRIREQQSAEILRKLKNTWFGYRTLTYLKQLLADECGWCGGTLDAGLADFSQYRTKSTDLGNLLSHLKLLTGDGP